MPSKKERKRKNPVYLKRVIKNAREEIGVLERRLYSNQIPVSQTTKIENRICTLMNKTIPNAEESLKERLFFL